MTTKLIRNTELNKGTHVLRFERNGISFIPGCHLLAGTGDKFQMREYSVFSGIHENYLEILVKEIPYGEVSPKLTSLEPGETLQIDGPAGYFNVPPDYKNKSHCFVATGTGIAPFNSIIASHSGINYVLFHGVRTSDELLAQYLQNGNYIPCLTDENGYFRGRVTDYFRKYEIKHDYYYLCGNSAMIYELYALLSGQGISRNRIFAEVYF